MKIGSTQGLSYAHAPGRTRRVMKAAARAGAIMLGMVLVLMTGALYAQVTTLSNWTNVYHGSSGSAQTATVNIPAGSGQNRLLVVAIASSRTTSGSVTGTVTYGGRTLTSAGGDFSSTGINQHTAFYYLNESNIDLASNSTLSVTASGGTIRVNDFWVAVFDNVNQTTPIADNKNANSSSNATTVTFSSNLTVNANDLAVVVTSSFRSGNTTPRTISTYPTSFTMVNEQTFNTTDGVRNFVANRSIPTSNTSTAATTTFSGNCWPSQTGITIGACAGPTVNVGSALSAICIGGTSAALGGSVGGSATGGTWSDGGVGGTFSASSTTLNATYTPPVSYTGTVTLTLTTSGGTCGVASASKTLAVNPKPTSVTASASSTSICSGNSINLTSSATSNSGLTGTALSESFNGSISSWTLANSSTGGTPANAAWTLRASGYNDGNETFTTPDASQFIISSSDLQGSGGTTNTSLTSPAFSTSGMSAASINLSHYYRFNTGTDDRAFVEASTNGTSWTTLTTYSSTQGTASAFANPTIALTAGFLNQATVYVRFRYTGSWDWYWAINTVSVSGTFTSAPAATFAWTSSPAGFTSALQNPTGVAPSATTTYTVTATNSFGCTAQASTSAVTVNASPAAPTGSDAQRCGNGTLTLTASVAAGSTVDWYDVATGGSIVSGGTGVTSFTTPSLSSTTTYHAQARNSTTGCVSASRTAVTATISQPPSMSNQSGSSTYGTATTYAISASNATSYSATGLPTGFTLNSSTGVITIAANAPAGSYSIDITAIAPGCTNATATLSYTRNTANLTITANNATKCFGSSLTLAGTAFTSSGLASGDAINSVTLTSDGTDIFADLGTYAIVPSSATGASFNASNYTITYTNGTLTVVDVPSFTSNPSTTGEILCQNVSATALSVTAIPGSGTLSYQWFSNTVQSSFGGTSISGATAATFTPPTATAGTRYYYCVASNSNGCATPSTASGAIVVNALPTTVTVSGGGTFCNNTTLTASNGSSGTIYFQGTTSNGTSTATPSTSQFISVAGTYYFRAQSAEGCWGTQGTAVVTLQAPIVTGVEICQGTASQALTTSTICADPQTNQSSGARDAGTGANVTGVGTVAWSNPGNITTAGTPFAGGTSIASGGTVTSNYLRATNYGFSIPSNAVITGITLVINRSSSGTASPYIRDNEVKLVKGGTIQSTNKAATTTDWSNNNVLGTATYGGSADLWGTTWTPAEINASDFGAVLSARNASTNNNRTPNVDYMRITVTYTIPGGYNWFTQSSGGTAIGSGASFNPVGVAGSGLANTNTAGTVTYYLECGSNPGCRGSANYVINALPAAPSVTGANRCGDGSVTLSASAGSGEEVDWYDAPTGGTLLASASNTYTTPSLSDTTTYYAVARNVDKGCVSSPRTAVEATINPILNASVSIVSDASGNSICAGTSVTFTATAINGGSSPSYQWKLNGSNVGSNSATYSNSALANGDVVSVELTSNASPCLEGSPATSNSITLTVRQPSSSTTNVTICSNQLPYSWNGNSYNAAGTYNVTLTNAANCDSVATLVLTVNNTSSSTTNVTICSNQLPYSWNSNSYSAAGTYNVTLTNAANCDSVATLVLTVNNTSSSTTNITRCSNQLPYSWNSNSYSAAGTYNVTLTNAAGCDSVATLVLTVNNTSSSSTSVSVCSNQLPYSWNGTDYNASGTYTFTSSNAAGCDSVATLVLTVNSTSSSSTSVTVCQSELPYSWNSNSYSAAGTYNVTLSNAAGCDSVATLVLTVNSNTFAATTATACDTYSWNGTNYTASGTYTYSYNNGSGCASVDTLHLTIHPSYDIDTTAVVCGQLVWYGDTLTTSGNYTKAFSSQFSCDSVISLTLTVHPLPTTPGAVSGPVEVCTLVGSSTPSTYSIASVVDAVSYQWTLPPGATLVSGQGTTSIGVTFDNTLSSTNQRIRVSSVSDQGCLSPQSFITLTKTPPSRPFISGPNSVCDFMGQSTQATYTCDSVDRASGYNWTVPSGATLVSGQGTRTIQVTYASSFVSGSITVAALSNCASLAPRSFLINRTIPAQPGAITGPTNACANFGTSTTSTYSISAVTGATSYLWTVPAGVTLVSGQGTNSVQVTFGQGFVTSAIRVRSVANCGNSTDRTLTISGANYSAPGSISGPTNSCPFINNNDAQATYTIRRVANAPGYLWTLPQGMTITSRPGNGTANDTIILVRFDSTFVAGSSLVVRTTGCGTSAARSLTIGGTLIGTPGTLTGPTNVCQLMVSPTRPVGDTATYRVRKIFGATSYTWNITGNAQIIGRPGGAGTANDTVILVKFQDIFTSGTVSVRASNACGTSSPRNLSVTRLNVGSPGNIDISFVSACPNRVVSYTLPAMPSQATSVNWTVPEGATILSGQGTTSITVSYPPTTVSGFVRAQAINNCSSSSFRSVNVKLIACPASFTGGENPESRSVETITPAVEQFEVGVYPNPTTTEFNLNLRTSSTEKVMIRVYDMQGRMVKTYQPAGQTQIRFGNDLKAGSYLVEILQGGRKTVQRLMKF